MRSCTSPVRDSVVDYDWCVGRSRGPKRASLQARRTEVLEHYAAYSPAGARANLVPRSGTWPVQEANWQRDLYELTYEGGPLQDIRGAALEAAENRCLLCSVTPTGSLDHFLPRESFPSLSLFALNLVAACDNCNRTKGTAAHDDPARQFVHPYFDPIPLDVVFLQCSPFVGTVLSPDFSIVPCAGVDDDLHARLCWQFDLLELNELYRNEAVKFFRGSRFGWRELAQIDPGRLVTEIERSLRSEVFAFGCNEWKPAFLRGLTGDAGFVADPLAYLQ